jgi:hypothetical protein
MRFDPSEQRDAMRRFICHVPRRLMAMHKLIACLALLALPVAAWAFIKPVLVLAPELAGVQCHAVICSKQACSKSFGFTSADAYNFGTVAVVISHRGWKPYFVTHELSPRRPLPEPLQSYRSQFEVWFRHVALRIFGPRLSFYDNGRRTTDSSVTRRSVGPNSKANQSF